MIQLFFHDASVSQNIYLSRVEKLLSFTIIREIIKLKNFIFPFKFISIRKRYANISFKLILNDIYVTKLRSLKKISPQIYRTYRRAINLIPF